MKRFRYANRPTNVSEMAFQDMYEEISENWRQKAERLQARRRRALKRSLKNPVYTRTARHA